MSIKSAAKHLRRYYLVQNYIINFGFFQQKSIIGCNRQKRKDVTTNIKRNFPENPNPEEMGKQVNEIWTSKKKDNIFLADVYASSKLLESGKNKARRMLNCGRWLEYAIPPENIKAKPKLIKASSCHVRLCPICQWRRTLNTYRNLSLIYAKPEIQKEKHLFLTLTQKNVNGEDLSKEIQRINKSYTALMRKKELSFVKGYCKTVEVTYNTNTDTFHPHIHAILTVPNSYGKKQYLTHEQWRDLWKNVLGLEYSPRVSVSVISKLDGKTVAEVSKYSVKPSSYIRRKDQDHITKKEFLQTQKIIEMLDIQLDGKRFISLGGDIKKAKADLKIKDIEEDENEPPENWKEWEKVIYEWNFQDAVYKKCPNE